MSDSGRPAKGRHGVRKGDRRKQRMMKAHDRRQYKRKLRARRSTRREREEGLASWNS